MPEGDGDEMVCHLKQQNAEIGDVFAKVNTFYNFHLKVNKNDWKSSVLSSNKINVNGNSAIPLYKYLKEKQSGFFGSAIKWNFTKFLVDKNGQPVDRFAPTTDPSDLVKEIEKLL